MSLFLRLPAVVSFSAVLLLLIGAASAAPDGGATQFDYAGVSRLGSIDGERTKVYGVLSDAVTVGENLRDAVAASLAEVEPSRGFSPTPRYTILLGNEDGVQQVDVGMDWISDGYGVSRLSPKQRERLDRLVYDNFPTPFSDVDAVNAYVGAAPTAPTAARARFVDH